MKKVGDSQFKLNPLGLKAADHPSSTIPAQSASVSIYPLKYPTVYPTVRNVVLIPLRLKLTLSTEH